MSDLEKMKEIEERVEEMGKRFEEMEPYAMIGHAALEWFLEDGIREKDERLRNLVNLMAKQLVELRKRGGH